MSEVRCHCGAVVTVMLGGSQSNEEWGRDYQLRCKELAELRKSGSIPEGFECAQMRRYVEAHKRSSR